MYSRKCLLIFYLIMTTMELVFVLLKGQAEKAMKERFLP